MFSFRQKIFISYIAVFLVFIALIFPFATYMVRKIATKAMEDRAKELIAKIESAPNDDALIRRLKEQKHLLFFRISVINNESKIIYDTHTKRLLGPRFSQEYVVDHPEVIQAFKNGVGYNEDYSELLEQKFSFFAKSFDFHGKTYVMRTAFPYKYVAELTHDCEISFLGLATLILLLFSVMTWFVIIHLTSPIQQIINAVTPYQEGKEATIPEIKLKASNNSDEFGKLAMTLNSMSSKIQKHIDTIITERNEKSAILESLVEGVIAIDENSIITYANDMALKLLGFDRPTLLGQNFSITNQPTCYALLMSCQREKKPLTNPLTITGKNNLKTFLDILAAPKGQNSGAILVMQDQTSHYKLLEMRKDFIANASHELKTPITIIRGFAEALHDNPDLPLETRSEVTGKIVKSCKRMTTLIKDLLTLSDIENIPQYKLMECDIYDMLQMCSDNLHDGFPDAQITIHKNSEEELDVIADPSLMELALMNLIENGIKYSTPPAQIVINLDKVYDNVQITIADKGIGIPAADLEHIFERFYTVDKAHSQKMGGSGLGLSIVQTIIHKHFGQISVESEVGKGTTFTILLPYSTELTC
ncbi:MAG: PAS domain-containing protein [Parachlamydiaceae bacterium]|nr:PAS domain-containing protein [Parachlamydiaceae bacterium]